MIMWGFPVLGCALLVSALLLRRWPLAALAVTLGGSVASMVLQPRPSSRWSWSPAQWALRSAT